MREVISLAAVREIISWFGRSTRQPDFVVFIGLSAKSAVFLCCVMFFEIPVVVRLGGHPLEDIKSLLSIRKRLSRLKYLANFAAIKLFLKFPRYVICVNEDLARRVRPALRGDAQVFVVPQFCEGAVVQRRREPGGTACLLTVANLNFMSKARGVIRLIEGLDAYCRRNDVSIRFTVAGGGMCVPVVERFLDAFDLHPLFKVELRGFVEDVNPLYAGADVFLYHSEHDGTPNVLLEAKRWGIPTLVNDYPAFRSVVTNGESGLIFGSEEEFHTMLKQVLESAALRQTLSDGARRDHEARFSKEAVARRLEDVVQTVAGRDAHRQRH